MVEEWEGEREVGFTAWLMLIYAVLIALTVLAFVKKRKAVAFALIAVMVAGVAVLGYMLFTSPM